LNLPGGLKVSPPERTPPSDATQVAGIVPSKAKRRLPDFLNEMA
jgi:hypothetical protein